MIAMITMIVMLILSSLCWPDCLLQTALLLLWLLLIRDVQPAVWQTVLITV